LKHHGLPLSSDESFVLVAGGRVCQKLQALFRIARCMRFPWPLLRRGLVLLRGVADYLYDRVAKKRYALFGKRDVYMIPR
jgi:predicted DCC family thiol-disulfide oxidoreductase YuxK